VRWVEVFGSALERRAGATRSDGPTAGAPEQASPDPGALGVAEHDPLTGLWNRRHFEEELDARGKTASAWRFSPSTWTHTAI
jgi:GGDEF domain-containing protein